MEYVTQEIDQLDTIALVRVPMMQVSYQKNYTRSMGLAAVIAGLRNKPSYLHTSL